MSLRIFYSAGPGNAYEVFRRWSRGEQDQTTSHVSYSGQMLDAATRHNARVLLSCTHAAADEQEHAGSAVIYRPDPTDGRSGAAYHHALHRRTRRDMRDAAKFGADIVILADGDNPRHFAPLGRRGVRVVQALHTRLWPETLTAPGPLKRHRLRSLGRVYASGDITILSCSDTVTAQVAKVAQTDRTPVVEFLPLYHPAHYAGLPPVRPDPGGPVGIAFVGRIEKDKGAFDLVRIASLLRADGVDACFHICGVGAALEQMRRMVSEHGLEAAVRFHGWLDHDGLRRIMAGCAMSIIPTRSEFVEGFNQAVVESILAGRPAVASSVCPAVHYVAEAAVVVPVDDIAGYVAAITRLARDPKALLHHAAACARSAPRFHDPATSFGAALDEVILAAAADRPVTSRRIPTAPG